MTGFARDLRGQRRKDAQTGLISFARSISRKLGYADDAVNWATGS